MSKKLDITAITNDLEGSAFFPARKPPSSPPTGAVPASLPTVSEQPASETTPSPLQPPKQPTNHAHGTPVPPVRGVPPVPSSQPKKRFMKQRHPFDIYQDQYDSLKQLALEERKLGGIGSMSAMVRAAIDTYISEKRKK